MICSQTRDLPRRVGEKGGDSMCLLEVQLQSLNLIEFGGHIRRRIPCWTPGYCLEQLVSFPEMEKTEQKLGGIKISLQNASKYTRG